MKLTKLNKKDYLRKKKDKWLQLFKKIFSIRKM